jgi:RNA polymerase sigma-70 factor (ECF subfamily)
MGPTYYSFCSLSPVTFLLQPRYIGCTVAGPKKGSEKRVLFKRKRETRLIRRAVRGDRDAIGELYNRHVDAVYRYVYSRVENPMIAEDITAEVFVKVLEALPSYRVTGAPFRAWLYSIARARTIDFWRKRGNGRVTEITETLAADGPQPEEAAAQQARWETVISKLPELTEDQHQVILLRFTEAMSLKETARMMGKTVGAVKLLQYRALASLARLLKESPGPSGARDD